MLQEYTPLLLLMGFVAANGVGMLVFSHLVSPQRANSVKGMPYESGITLLGGTRDPFSINVLSISYAGVEWD